MSDEWESECPEIVLPEPTTGHSLEIFPSTFETHNVPRRSHPNVCLPSNFRFSKQFNKYSATKIPYKILISPTPDVEPDHVEGKVILVSVHEGM